MKPVAVAHGILDCMSKSMSKIQQGAHAALTLICFHNFSLMLAASFYCVDQNRTFTFQQGLNMRFNPAEECWIANKAILDDLGYTGAQFPIGQCIERGCIRHY